MGPISKDLKIRKSKIRMTPVSLCPGNPASGWSTCRLTAVQENQGHFSFFFVFPVIYFFTSGFWKPATDGLMQAPRSRRRINLPTWGRGLSCRVLQPGIIHSHSASEWNSQNSKQLGFPLAPSAPAAGKICPCLVLGGCRITPLSDTRDRARSKVCRHVQKRTAGGKCMGRANGCLASGVCGKVRMEGKLRWKNRVPQGKTSMRSCLCWLPLHRDVPSYALSVLAFRTQLE